MPLVRVLGKEIDPSRRTQPGEAKDSSFGSGTHMSSRSFSTKCAQDRGSDGAAACTAAKSCLGAWITKRPRERPRACVRRGRTRGKFAQANTVSSGVMRSPGTNSVEVHTRSTLTMGTLEDGDVRVSLEITRACSSDIFFVVGTSERRKKRFMRGDTGAGANFWSHGSVRRDNTAKVLVLIEDSGCALGPAGALEGDALTIGNEEVALRCLGAGAVEQCEDLGLPESKFNSRLYLGMMLKITLRAVLV